VIRYEPTRPDDGVLRQRLRELAAERRRFGYRRLGYLLAREGITPNRKKLLRICREDASDAWREHCACIAAGRKRALGTRRPMVLPDGPNQRWSLDFVSDSLICGQRFRILCVVDDYTRECPALVAATSLSGARVAGELASLLGSRGKPSAVVSDNGTELTSSAILRWYRRNGGSNGATSRRARRCRKGWLRRSSGRCEVGFAALRVNGRLRNGCRNETQFNSLAHARFVLAAWRHDYNTVRPHSKLGGKTPAEIAGQGVWGMPPDTLPSHQTTIKKEPDPTSDG
jgi:putative transposase